MATAPFQDQESYKILNRTLVEKLSSNDTTLVKQAQDTVNDFTRIFMREEGIARKIIPPVMLTNDDLDRQVNNRKPVKIIDKEPSSPAAMSVGYGANPNSLYMKTDRYQVNFNRIITPKFTADVGELRTDYIDLRQVLSDNSIKDMLAEEDGRLLHAVNQCVVGPGAVVPTSGVIQHQEIYGGITRDSLLDSHKIMPSTRSSLEVKTCLVNNISIKDVAKGTVNEYGPGLSEELMRKGATVIKDLLGIDWIVTIKKGFVPTGTMYHFADTAWLGKSFMLEDATMYIKREAYFIEYFSYEELGTTIANTSAVARVDFKS